MRYISTRGQTPSVTFEEALLGGLAPDGGLYVPQNYPQFSANDIIKMRTLPYADIAKKIMSPFVGNALETETFERIVEDCYQDFNHSAVAPIRQLDHHLWFYELFHGPTLAFKDYALQLVGRLFDAVLQKNGQRLTIVGATSGDTGSAAIAACAGAKNIDIFILHPKGRVSPVQERQMTSVLAPNVHNIALEGSFDDCQDQVKALFADKVFREEVCLGAVNSINWGRIMGQVAYYAVACARLARADTPLDISVPSGNFGNIFAAYVAKRMGFPIGQLGVSSNKNDILARFLTQNDMSIKAVEPSHAPSMDIQISSNFERYLFELMERDGASLARKIQDFRKTGKMQFSTELWACAQQDFISFRLDDAGIEAEIKRWYKKTGLLLCPHSVIAVAHAAQDGRFKNPVLCIGTAHPAKFPDVVQRTTGIYPQLPDNMKDLMERKTRCINMANDTETLKAFVRERQ